MRRPVLMALVAAVAAVLSNTAPLAEAVAAGPPAFLTAAASAAPAPFSGVVAEVLDVPGYTYARVVEDTGPGRWTVTLSKDLAVGTVVEVRPFGALDDFHSKRADRSFDRLVFATLTPSRLP